MAVGQGVLVGLGVGVEVEVGVGVAVGTLVELVKGSKYSGVAVGEGGPMVVGIIILTGGVGAA